MAKPPVRRPPHPAIVAFLTEKAGRGPGKQPTFQSLPFEPKTDSFNIASFINTQFMKRTMLVLAVLASLASIGSAQRICGSDEHLQQQLQADPGLRDRMEAIEQFTNQYLLDHPASDRTVVTIPVVVHVLYKTAAQNISDAQIASQLTVLNNDFRKLNTEWPNTPSEFLGLVADCEVQFCMAQRDPSGAATNGIVRKSTTVTNFGTNDAVKFNSSGGDNAWPAASYLNLWVCQIGGGILGYAQFPGGAANTDGVVIDYRYFGTIGTATPPFHLGRTATHEVGHWLNLRHIWGDANCGNDQVSDTPIHTTSNYGCPAYPTNSTCGGTAHAMMTMNYMDYTDDACMYMFSTGQKNRAQALFATGGSRNSLTTSLGCQPPTGGSCGTPGSLSAGSITTSSATKVLARPWRDELYLQWKFRLLFDWDDRLCPHLDELHALRPYRRDGLQLSSPGQLQRHDERLLRRLDLYHDRLGRWRLLGEQRAEQHPPDRQAHHHRNAQAEPNLDLDGQRLVVLRQHLSAAKHQGHPHHAARRLRPEGLPQRHPGRHLAERLPV